MDNKSKSSYKSANKQYCIEKAALLNKHSNNTNNEIELDKFNYFNLSDLQSTNGKLNMENTSKNNCNIDPTRMKHDSTESISNKDNTMKICVDNLRRFEHIEEKTSRRKRIQKAILVSCMFIISLMVFSIFIIFIIHLFSPNITERLNISQFIPESVDKLSKKIDVIKRVGISLLNTTNTSEVTTMSSTSDLPTTSSIKDISTIPTTLNTTNTSEVTTMSSTSDLPTTSFINGISTAFTALNATYAIND
ncbi:hypothetical protein NEPAR06_0825 [Nematocida parisii]|uniref:Uncharacterized protein n=1 Tax=Nematocida parisii (strain ERTm3) TaxID=935791 RepID=I3EEJ4_NEMP3|nr:uncharacterized protein NEPG_02268 [Nematocida parisii ERTm1]EIJ87641.1 hypothetical protein NEQG_02188 [Nematocida parisii ERTm3]KAI5128995.1 hypothetical protein NEPAR08_1429 [Nematocida parisii]EIJ92869.1 hypothetical protein NEPG_02268 [Nematocida parisii ERTm1]KAI5129176.1 hypothetical protein NEPAR03_1576 [Nematocida parisii]KAI5142070.1 hypothetical protein NEPAR04_1426 [Nematocida parisii]|eukprot:XP_013060095.1 hypothetical protein NEPG_02268 [Nematocida parisii ERTm1]